MNKYYKVEDIINFLNVYCPKDMWEYQIADLPTIEVSEDCISKASVISALSLYRNLIETELAPRVSAIKDIVLGTTDDCIELVGKAPSVVPSRAEGEWVKQGLSPYEGIRRCSLCGNVYNITEDFNYCPNCGAKMKG